MNELKVLQLKHIENVIISEIQGTLYTLKQLKRALLDNEITFAEAKRKGANSMAKLAALNDRLYKINIYMCDNNIEVSELRFNYLKEFQEVNAFFGNV